MKNALSSNPLHKNVWQIEVGIALIYRNVWSEPIRILPAGLSVNYWTAGWMMDLEKMQKQAS